MEQELTEARANELIDSYIDQAKVEENAKPANYQITEHFSSSELCCHHCGVCNINSKLVDALEIIRARVGKPIIVNSAYRCVEHNAAVGGAKDSMHLKGKAADIRIEGYTGRDLYNIVESSKLFNGIGRNDYHNYVHVDLREQGLVRWCYDAKGKVVSYHD